MSLKEYLITGQPPALGLTEVSAEATSSLRLPGRYSSMEAAREARMRLIRQNDAEHAAQRVLEFGTLPQPKFVTVF